MEYLKVECQHRHSFFLENSADTEFMKKLILLPCVFLILSGCAHLQYGNRIKEWVGKSQQDIIGNFGPPQSTFKDAQGNEYYTYVSKGEAVTQSRAKAWNFNGEKELVTTQPECKTVFSFNSSAVVSSARAQGDC